MPEAITPWAKAIARAERDAPFLRQLMIRNPSLAEEVAQRGADACFAERLAHLTPEALKTEDKESVARLLRITRQEVALIVALADLAEAWPIDVAAQRLSQFAEQCIACALWVALRTVYEAGHVEPDAQGDCGLVCLALGKLGGGELNYSSDVDLIFFYDEEKIRTVQDPHKTFTRLVRDVVNLLDTRDDHGYVLRIDLRLRPDPNATPNVISMGAAEAYYQSSALTWERAAFTRARVVAGDRAAGEAFLNRLSGWVWRKSLDFTAIRDIHDIRLHMGDHFGQEEWRSGGFDLKRGVGGIREIEFFLQVHQLIYGGRVPALRQRNTLEGLRALYDAGYIPHTEYHILDQSYRRLRSFEHRLQMREDAQTHTVPTDLAERTQFARLCGFRSATHFDKALLDICTAVHAIYARITDAQRPDSQTIPYEMEALLEHLTALGFEAHTTAILERWRSTRYKALRSARAQAALEKCLPQLLEALSQAHHPSVALARFDDFLERLPAGVQFLELLEKNRKLLDLLARVLSISPSLATDLSRTPSLLDAVFDADFFKPPSSPTVCMHELRQVVGTPCTESHLDAIARWLAEKRFQIGVLLIDGVIDGRHYARYHAWLMDAVAGIVFDIAENVIAKRYGLLPQQKGLILALGGWGGEALMSTSDLDVIFLFTGAHDQNTISSEPISATHYFNRLAQRFIGYMTASTAAGTMADIDTRLRPSGNKGLLCVSLSSFAEYERNEAWTWEHLALTRARPIGAMSAPALETVHNILKMPRPAERLYQDALDMRADIATHKPAQGPWDVKHPRGGLIDIEFITHVLQLHTAPRALDVLHPSIETALARLADAGALSRPTAQTLIDAYERFIAVRVILSLCAEGDTTLSPLPKAIISLLSRVLGSPREEAMREEEIHSALAHTLRAVTRAWDDVFSPEETL